MPVKNILLAIILYFPFAALYPQTPSYNHYTTIDGLASSTVYNILQDRNGFIWFATLNGLSKFDGKHFTTFRTNEGLNSNSIISLAVGKKNELFIGNYEKGINVLRNGHIENYCNEINGIQFSLSFLLLVPSGNNEQTLYAYRSSGTIGSITEQKNSRLITHNINPSPIEIYRLSLLRNNEILAITPSGLYSFKKTRLIKKQIQGLPDTAVLCLAEASDGSYYTGTRGMIYRIMKDRVVGSYKVNITANNDVCAILADKNNNVWFSVMNRGFFLIPRGSDKIIDIGSKMGLQNTLVNNYLQDNEGNIWVSTYGKGVFCLNNLYLKSYNENDGMSSNSVYSIASEKSGKLLIGTFNGLNILENGKFHQIKGNTKRTLTEYIYSVKKTDNEYYVSGAFGETGVKKISYKELVLHFFDRPSFCKTSTGLYLFGGSGNYIVIQSSLKNNPSDASMLFLFNGNSKSNRINEIFEDTKKNIWTGTSLGLCKIAITSSSPRDWKKTFFHTDPVLNSRINAICQDNKQHVWFAGEKGIARYNLEDESVKSYTSINGYDLSSATSIVADNRNRIWIGSMNGLFLFDGNSVKYLNRQTGLPSDEVLSLCYDSNINFLYVGTSNGISSIDIGLFDKYAPHPLSVKIINIKAGDSIYSSFNNLVFRPEQNHIYIDYRALCYSSPGSVKYKYNLNGESSETDRDFLDFSSLQSGMYVLQIMAKSQNSEWGEPCNLIFKVRPRFYETVWFMLGILLIIILASFSAVTWRLKQHTKKVNKELELTERFNKLEHQALSAMMNPHFISNSLNSVQYLINSGKYEDANDYIAMIAKLMRKNLDTAGSGFILLSEEISRLRLYLDLEKLRFQESFTYEIITGTDVDADNVMIPNMIIQPFVENSIWHGIINSGSQGLLIVSFFFEEVDIDSHTGRSLIIRITDNGIGIDQAKKNKKEDHISKGIQIIEERLRLLSARLELPQPIMFEDLSSLDSDSHGTEVIISLPPPLYKISVPGSGSPASPTA